ncbi:putative spermidine/putrescine transport system permease protein [Neorhizobium galegae]|uniref:ABC transporter permease n=1 Tax=Neorhizobium galegae TaxID=399 RepID=UPI00278A1D7A|nr:ABC transporter permease [Neorhizobium galegae]MDQ0134128.1 putative spermidine/putrescine transport system permease protein [Neorhizobium galegae]
MKFGRATLLLLLPCVGLLISMLTGVGSLVIQAFAGSQGPSIANFTEFTSRPEVVGVFWYTHEVALIVTLICVFFSYPLAVFMAMRPRLIYLILILLPLMVSIVVRTYGWVVLLGPRGLVNTLLIDVGLIDRPMRLMFNTGGVVVGLVHIFIPFAVLSILAVYVKIEKSLPEAAMSLGASPFKVFTKVILPLSLPGVATAATIVYLLTLGAIVTPLLLGGQQQTMLGTMIYNQMLVYYNFPAASASAILLTASAAIAVIPFQLIDRWATRKLPGGEQS